MWIIRKQITLKLFLEWGSHFHCFELYPEDVTSDSWQSGKVRKLRKDWFTAEMTLMALAFIYPHKLTGIVLWYGIEIRQIYKKCHGILLCKNIFLTFWSRSCFKYRRYESEFSWNRYLRRNPYELWHRLSSVLGSLKQIMDSKKKNLTKSVKIMCYIKSWRLQL